MYHEATVVQFLVHSWIRVRWKWNVRLVPKVNRSWIRNNKVARKRNHFIAYDDDAPKLDVTLILD